MDGTTTGAIAAVAFWTFVAVAVVATAWKEFALKRETERTIRSAIEKGQQLDAALVEKMLKPRTSRDRDGLLIGGAVCLAVGLGMPVMGYFISLGGDNEAVYPMAGVGALVTMIGIALLAARRFVSQSDASSEPPSFER